MIMNSSGNNFVGKQEQGAGGSNDSKFSKIPSSSRQWGGFKNPRIVRVSRSFGGKDRHSKVCTIRGLRDRRIRLSVPTAIQLYDLQDRLGLSQPSKVVDWLLDATKHEVDKLPPLQIPPGAFTTSDTSQPYSFSHLFNSNPSPYMKDEVKIGNLFDRGEKSKGNDHRETSCGKDKWIASNDQEGYVPQLSAQNLFPLGNQLNSNMPFSSYYHWEPSNHSFSDHSQNSTTLPVSLPSSSMSFTSGSQLYFCPTATTLPSIVPPYMINNNPIESDPRQLNHFHFLSSSSAPQHVLPYPLMPTLHLNTSIMKPFSLNEDPKGFHSREDDDRQQQHQGGSN